MTTSPVGTGVPSEVIATVNLKVTVSASQLKDLLITALEGGGSGYWCYSKVDYKYVDSKEQAMYDITHPNYKISVTDTEVGKNHSVNLGRLKVGLGDMSRKYPWHARDFVSGTWDATTSDVFLQCALFGQIRYG